MTRTVLLTMLCSSPSVALAGAGPWTLQPGEHNLYVGGDYFQYGSFVGTDGATALSTRITSAGGTAVWTFGMAYGLEGEVKLTYEAARVTRPDAPFCLGPDVPGDWCDPTHGLGDLAARFKWRFLDEGFNSPISVAIDLGMRSGEGHANRRARLTALGDGTTDLSAGVSLGRTATLGRSGWYQLSGDVGYWYRLPNIVEDGVKVPADEISGELALLASLHPRFGIGPSVAGFSRLGGVDLGQQGSYADADSWSRLDSAQLKIGGKLGLYSLDNGPTISISVLRTVLARNNPSDTLALSMGIGTFLQPRD